jgi:peptide deformylase
MICPVLRLNKNELTNAKMFLRGRSEEIVRFDSVLLKLVENLTDTMNSYEIAVGLSAVQIGVASRVFVLDTTRISLATGIKRVNHGIRVFINPRILSVSRKTTT